MDHNLFKPKNLEEGKHAVVGDCNNMSMADRWRLETPLFAEAILEQVQLSSAVVNILDYGCGVGRLAAEVLRQDEYALVTGVDASSVMLEQANKYVASDRFTTRAPSTLAVPQRFDLVYCVYVLQHAPAIEIRDILQRIHYSLKDGGTFVYCSSDYRMAIKFDGTGFGDDRSFGVNLQEEIERYFDKVGPLFSDQMFKENQVLRVMVKGEGNNLPHPAFVYKKKPIIGPLFNAQTNGIVSKNEAPVIAATQVEKVPTISQPEYTKLVLINRLAPGDILVMTNALRDLHLAYPGKYQTEVRTPCNSIFENNPYCTRLSYNENEYQIKEKELHKGDKDGSTFTIGDTLFIDMHYPLIHTSGEAGWHFSYGHRDFLEKILGITIPQTGMRPEIYLSQSERDWISPVLAATGDDRPYWVINAGSKGDYTLKQYPYYQEVVDLLKDTVRFVQVGLAGHNHIPLKGVIDLVGQTPDPRKLFRVIYHSSGVLTCVSFPMHIAAAFNKPCVVVAGGREGPRWEMYPNHQYQYVNGCLPCATYDGCWKSKFEDCVNKVGTTPKCMTLITPRDIARSIERYYDGGILTR